MKHVPIHTIWFHWTIKLSKNATRDYFLLYMQNTFKKLLASLEYSWNDHFPNLKILSAAKTHLGLPGRTRTSGVGKLHGDVTISWWTENMRMDHGCVKVVEVDHFPIFGVLPWKLTWNPKIEVWKMIFLFKQVIFRFHVNFPGCNAKNWKPHHLAKHPKPLQTRTILPSKGITVGRSLCGWQDVCFFADSWQWSYYLFHVYVHCTNVPWNFWNACTRNIGMMSRRYCIYKISKKRCWYTIWTSPPSSNITPDNNLVTRCHQAVKIRLKKWLLDLLVLDTDTVDRSEIRRSPVEVGSEYPIVYNTF